MKTYSSIYTLNPHSEVLSSTLHAPPFLFPGKPAFAYCNLIGCDILATQELFPETRLRRKAGRFKVILKSQYPEENRDSSAFLFLSRGPGVAVHSGVFNTLKILHKGELVPLKEAPSPPPFYETPTASSHQAQ